MIYEKQQMHSGKNNFSLIYFSISAILKKKLRFPIVAAQHSIIIHNKRELASNSF